jgi:hypothetical protein
MVVSQGKSIITFIHLCLKPLSAREGINYLLNSNFPAGSHTWVRPCLTDVYSLPSPKQNIRLEEVTGLARTALKPVH